jgi:hypothetical protein
VQVAFHELPQRFQTRDGGFAQFLDALLHQLEIRGAGGKTRMGLGIYGPLRLGDAWDNKKPARPVTMRVLRLFEAC